MNRTLRAVPQAGFTIIETLIVLAIAGVFFLIVFGAIPALERNSRNNQRLQDVTLALQAVSRYELNDSGSFPADCGGTATPCSGNASSGSPNDYFLKYDDGKLSYYTNDEIYLHQQDISNPPDSSTANDKAPASNKDQVDIYNYEKCDSSGDGSAKVAGAGYNDVVALFAIETGTGTASQCRQL